MFLGLALFLLNEYQNIVFFGSAFSVYAFKVGILIIQLK